MTFIFANVLNEAQNGCSLSLYRTLLETCGPNDTFATFNWDTLLDRALLDTGGWNPNTGYGLTFRAMLDGSWKDSERTGGKPYSPPTGSSRSSTAPQTGWSHTRELDLTLWSINQSVPNAEHVFLYWHSTLPYHTHQNRWTGGYVPTTYCYYPPNIPAEYFTQEQISAGPGPTFVRYTDTLSCSFPGR